MMSSDLSTITGWKGYDEIYPFSEFAGYDDDDLPSVISEVLKVDLSFQQCHCGCVFWKRLDCELAAPATDEELENTGLFDLLILGQIKDKVKHLLEEMLSDDPIGLLIQFWAPEVVDQHLYLTTSNQPFAFDTDIRKGLCWYRKRCMDHRYRVDDGAQEEGLGAVGRAYRTMHIESTPDLKLYSTNEFPLRDFAAGCGVTYCLVLPVFDLLKEKCYGVIEILSIDHVLLSAFRLERLLQAADLATTDHYHDHDLQDAGSEIRSMLELASRAVPQLQLARVSVPCHECSNTSSNLSCMESDTFTKAESVNSLISEFDIFGYSVASRIRNLQVGKSANMIAAVMSSNNKSCICQNICDFSISENPSAHYAQKARLSFCFAICLESLQNSRDFYVVEFFLQCNSVNAFARSVLPLRLRIMEMKLKNFKFAYKGKQGQELVVEVLKENMLSSGELSQSNALRYESVKYMHQCPKELSMLVGMEGHKGSYPLSYFTRYLQKFDLHCLQPSGKSKHGWVFWSQARQELQENEVDSTSSNLSNPIQKKIKRLMREITSEWDWDSYALAQFWAPKTDADRCYLEALSQPFALGSLHKGLAYFRKQCMKHHYYVDDRAKEEELGPPGRVFLNRHPEITLDLRLYSPTEFPLRNHAAHCHLRTYFALPVFDSNQHTCVGVLELLEFSNSTLDEIEIALEVANLSSTHINFKPSFLGSHLPCNDAECRRVALTEIQEACKLFTKIPQLYMVEVWVPYNECPSNNNTLRCMERVWTTKEGRESDLPMHQFQHVATRKGIAGMALASETKSCFCWDLLEFSIIEQPLVHYTQQARLDACFAIFLRSRHTSNLLYLLEFYLNQGPTKYKYLRSLLNLLLSIMKQKLGSFKVASGQQLGEELVVEVIEFSEVSELAISELDQLDIFPNTFKFVRYGGQKLSEDKQILFGPDGMESFRSCAQAERCNTSATNLKKEDATKKSKGGRAKTRQQDSEDKQVHFPSDADMDSRQENASNKTERGKRKTGHLNINLQNLEPYFGQKLEDVAKQLGVGRSTIKRKCREIGIHRWPSNENYKKNPSFYMGESAEESAQDSQQNTCPSPFSNLPPSDMPLHENAPCTNPKNSQGLMVQPTVDMVVVKVKYEDKTIKFELCHSAGLEKLMEEVSKRLHLETVSFELEYLDEDNDKVLLACDDDLRLCLKNTAAGKTCIQMFVKPIWDKLFRTL